MIDIVESLRAGTEAEDGLIIVDVQCLDAADEIERNRAAIAELISVGKAVVKRWDSPVWKDSAHTGDYINALRDVIAKHDTTNTTKGSN